jgi:hypothetical protein
VTVPRAWTLASYVALTFLLTYPLALRPGTTIVGSDADTDLFMWTLAWDTHAFTHQPLAIFDANIYHPYPRTLAYSENLIGSALLAAPVLWLTENPVLALNAVSLASVLLCGLGAHLLGRRLGMSHSGAFICGLVFAFAPSRLFRISQLHLTAAQWIPFALAALHAYLEKGRRRDLWLAAAFFSLQALTSGHGAVFLLVAVAGLMTYRVAFMEPLNITRRVRDLGVIGLLLLAPAVLVVVPYRIVQVEMGLRRTLADWTPAPESFLASPTHLQTFLLSLVPDARVMERASAILFPGFLTILLAAIAFRRSPPSAEARDEAAAVSRRHMRAFYGLLTLLSVLLAAGPLWPYVYWMPGMNFIRVPSRFMILATLGLSVLAGMGFERVRISLRPRGQRLLAIAVSALLLGEFIAIPFGNVPYEVKIPAADRWLNGQPKPFVVAEAPVLPLERYQTTYMLHAMAHWQKTVHGYSGMRPPLHETLYRQMRRFPDDLSLDSLRDLGVTYIVVHMDQYHEPGEWPEVEERLRRYEGRRLALEYQDRGSRVYSLKRN